MPKVELNEAPLTVLIGDRPDIRLDNEEEDDDLLGASPTDRKFGGSG